MKVLLVVALVLAGLAPGAAAVAAENGAWADASVAGGTHLGQEEIGPKLASGTTLAAKGAQASSAINANLLKKSLASLQQMGEKGTVIAGPGTKTPFRDASRVARMYGGRAEDWVKKASTSYTAPDGTQFETHWVENLITGLREEFKTVFRGGW